MTSKMRSEKSFAKVRRKQEIEIPETGMATAAILLRTSRSNQVVKECLETVESIGMLAPLDFFALDESQSSYDRS